MRHLSFGRKEGRGLGTRIPTFESMFESFTNIFSTVWRVRRLAIPDPGGAVADDGDRADMVRLPLPQDRDDERLAAARKTPARLHHHPRAAHRTAASEKPSGTTVTTRQKPPDLPAPQDDLDDLRI
jgi:hypothetical protein